MADSPPFYSEAGREKNYMLAKNESKSGDFVFVSKIKIENYRCFINFECNFVETKNVIIGHNCTGKSNLLQALGIIFNPSSKKRLTIDVSFL